jgi:hypothetical protein
MAHHFPGITDNYPHDHDVPCRVTASESNCGHYGTDYWSLTKNKGEEWRQRSSSPQTCRRIQNDILQM